MFEKGLSRQGPKVPGYRLHMPSGRAVVTLDGRDHYLGPHGSDKSREAYHRVVCDWLTTRLSAGARRGANLTVAELILANDLTRSFVPRLNLYLPGRVRAAGPVVVPLLRPPLPSFAPGGTTCGVVQRSGKGQPAI